MTVNLTRARRILFRAASQHQRERLTFSKHEISTKLQEIKTLASQKSIPKVKIQAEIYALEEKLEGIYEIEKRILQEKKDESGRERSLKKQIIMLQQRLELTKDKNIHLKVEKINSLLAEYLAKHHIHKEVAHQKAIQKAKKTPATKSTSPPESTSQDTNSKPKK